MSAQLQENNQFFRSTAKGLIARSARLLSMDRSPLRRAQGAVTDVALETEKTIRDVG